MSSNQESSPNPQQHSPQPDDPPSIPQISQDDLKKFRVGFTLREIEPIHSVDFSHDGMHVIYNTGSHIKVITLRDDQPSSFEVSTNKYPSKIAKFTRAGDILHTSLNDNTVRVLDQRSKSYKVYCAGHTEPVTSMSTSKMDDNVFVTGSQDCSVRIWDSKSATSLSTTTFSAAPIVAMHPTEKRVAVAYRKGGDKYVLEVFDLRMNAVANFEVECEFEWCDMRYSNDGRTVMVNTCESLIMIVDMEYGEVVHRLYGGFIFDCVDFDFFIFILNF
jgi:hypothetical protein